MTSASTSTSSAAENNGFSSSAKIPTSDRWAIILYLRALERGRAATLADLEPAERTGL